MSRLRSKVAMWFFNYMTRSRDDQRLDPFGAIADVTAEILDHNLFERAVTRADEEIMDLRRARYSLRSVAPTCSHVPDLAKALKEASNAAHALRTALKNPDATDFDTLIQMGRAAAQHVRELLVQHSNPT